MQNQTFRLSLKPDDYPTNVPYVYANQYDVGRTFVATIIDVNGQAFTANGETATICGTKPDGTGFSYDLGSVTGSTVSFSLTGQMTVVHGVVRCGIILTKNSTVVGTLAFMLYVQPAALQTDTIISSDDFGSIITDAVAEWMDEHGIVIDDTLTVPGAAADAKKTGDEINALKSAVNVLEPTASSADIGKALKVKTVEDGKVAEYEFGDSGSVGSVYAEIINMGKPILNQLKSPRFSDNNAFSWSGTFGAGIPYVQNDALIIPFKQASDKVSVFIKDLPTDHVIYYNVRIKYDQVGTNPSGRITLKNNTTNITHESYSSDATFEGLTKAPVTIFEIQNNTYSSTENIIRIQSPVVFDLTATFGAGNEPNIESVKAFFAAYYDMNKVYEKIGFDAFYGDLNPAYVRLMATNTIVPDTTTTGPKTEDETTKSGNGSSTSITVGINGSGGMPSTEVVAHEHLSYVAGWFKFTGSPSSVTATYNKQNKMTGYNSVTETLLDSPENDHWYRFSQIIVPSSANREMIVSANYADAAAQAAGSIVYKEFISINLSNLFGLGNEISDPTIVDGMLAKFPDMWYPGTKDLASEAFLKSLMLNTRVFGQGAYFGMNRRGQFQASSVIDQDDPIWTRNQYTYGLNKNLVKLPHIFDGGLETNGMYTVMLPKYARWEQGAAGVDTGSLFGGHVFEAWNNIGTYRLTMMMAHGGDQVSADGQSRTTAREDEACIIVYSPANSFNNPLVTPTQEQSLYRITPNREDYYNGNNSQNLLGRVRIGSDTASEGVVFTRTKMISYNDIILANSDGVTGKKLKFNNDNTVTWETVDLYPTS